MGAETHAVLFPGPWAVVPGLALIGVGVFMARNGVYRRWARHMNPPAAEKSPHGYLAGPLTIAFFGLLGVGAGLIALITGR